jgi:hypothetical protein
MTMRVITVHGTNDGAARDEGALWWQKGSAFSGKLQALAEGNGDVIEIRPFRWDGANSDVSRRKAASRLRSLLRAALKNDDKAAVIGHSHGGNVIAFALEDPALARAQSSGKLKVISVGTPFLPARRRLIADLNSIAVRSVVAFTAIVVLMVAAILARWLDGVLQIHKPTLYVVQTIQYVISDIRHIGDDEIANFIELAEQQGGAGIAEQVERLAPVATIILVAIIGLVDHAEIVAGFATITFLLAIAPVYRGLRILGERQSEAAPRSPGAWTIITHPADEAISLLASALRTRLEPTSPQSLARAARRSSPLIALIAMIAAIAGILRFGPGYFDALPERLLEENEALIAARLWQESLPQEFDLSYTWEPSSGFVVDQAAIDAAAKGDAALAQSLRDAIDDASRRVAMLQDNLDRITQEVRAIARNMMPAILAAAMIVAALGIWLLQLLWLLASPVIGRVASALANQSITGAMRGAAFGEDGDFVIRGAVTMPPSRFRGVEAALPADVIERMHADADRNAGETLRKIRRTLIADPARFRGDAYGDLLRSVSWRELIHTSYFEVDEVASIISASLMR